VKVLLLRTRHDCMTSASPYFTPAASTPPRTPVGFAFKCPNNFITPWIKPHHPILSTSLIHQPPSHVTFPTHTIETRVQLAVDEMQALESTPIISDFAQKYDVPYQRLQGRLYGTLAKSDLIPGNRRFSEIEEKAICRYLDRLDKLGLPAQREHLRGRRTIF
jgi:hypothetical protein